MTNAVPAIWMSRPDLPVPGFRSYRGGRLGLSATGSLILRCWLVRRSDNDALDNDERLRGASSVPALGPVTQARLRWARSAEISSLVPTALSPPSWNRFAKPWVSEPM